MALEDRPSFKELHLTISNYLECIAGYLQMDPFHQKEWGMRAAKEKEKEKYELDTLTNH